MIAQPKSVKALRYKSSNGHTVTLYGRLFFTVTSASRKNKIHFTDLEPFEDWKTVCTCEAWKWGERPCRHIAACFEAISVWGEIPEEIQEEWIERMMFLLNMGHSFMEALRSPSITTLSAAEGMTASSPTDAQASKDSSAQKRKYTLKPRPIEATTANY